MSIRKAKRTSRSFRWARDGAIAAIILSGVSLLLPERYGGFGVWSDPHLAVHNLAAVATRIVLFAILGGLLGSLWGRRRGKNA